MNSLRVVIAYVLSLAIGLVLQFIQLPTGVAMLWPLWLMLLLAAWAANTQGPHLLMALLLGVALDVGFAGTLGEHAVVLLLTTYVVMRAAPRLNMQPWWQAAIMLMPLWVAGTFLLMVLDHFSHHEAGLAQRWWPVVAEALLWPLVNHLIARLSNPPYRAAA